MDSDDRADLIGTTQIERHLTTPQSINADDLPPEAKIVYEAILRRDVIRLRLVDSQQAENVAVDEPYVYVIRGSRQATACTFYRGTRRVHFSNDGEIFYGMRNSGTSIKVEKDAYVSNLADIINYLVRDGRYTTDQI